MNFKFALISLALISNLSFAGEKIEVSVKGMVCAYCSSGVERSFGRLDEVEQVKVDLDSKLVSLQFKDNMNLNDEQITEVITKSGLNVEFIKRNLQ